MEDRPAPSLKPLEKVAALIVVVGAAATLAYAFGETWIG